MEAYFTGLLGAAGKGLEGCWMTRPCLVPSLLPSMEWAPELERYTRYNTPPKARVDVRFDVTETTIITGLMMRAWART